jgi:phage head maturation protease
MTEPQAQPQEERAGPVEVRAVDEAQRLVTMRIARWGELSRRTQYPRGERLLPGVFTRSIGLRRDRIPIVTRHTGGTGHIDERTKVARPIAWQDGPDELAAVLKFYDTPGGWAAYDRARDGEIDAGSVGFRATEERTAADGAREVIAAELHHFALLSTRDGAVPAYDGPAVLEVRQAPDSADLLAVEYAADLGDSCVDPAWLARLISSG